MPDLRSPRVWRARDAAVFDFLARHSATAAHVAAFFGGRTLAARKKKAYRWLARQRRRRRVRVVGVVQRRDTGRPEIVYGRRCRPSEIEHEVRVADLATHFAGCPFERGVKVGGTEPDAVVVRDGKRCLVEVDNSGKMTARQMQAKWRRYLGVDGFILVVALTEGRMQRLRAGAELVKDKALFTTFARLRSGAPNHWVDVAGDATDV